MHAFICSMCPADWGSSANAYLTQFACVRCSRHVVCLLEARYFSGLLHCVALLRQQPPLHAFLLACSPTGSAAGI